MKDQPDEERIERARQEREAAWAVVEEELWWLLSIPDEYWRPHDEWPRPFPDYDEDETSS